MFEAYLQALDLGYYEVTFAFEGLADEHVWKRPSPELLSVGELAGHIAYWEAVRFASDGDGEPRNNLANCRVSSPLLDHRFAYYPLTLPEAPSEEHLAMTAKQVCDELTRVHTEAIAHFKTLNPDMESKAPGYPQNYTYGEFVRYAAFHIAYHTGQMFSARFLLGETPPDN